MNWMMSAFQGGLDSLASHRSFPLACLPVTSAVEAL